MPLYALAGALIVAGLTGGVLVSAVHGLELLALALLAADAWRLRQRTPVLSSPDKAVAAGGWALVILGAITLAIALPPL